MQRFVGKIAVVTGASSGIGAETAKELVKHGVIVVGLARRVERLQELANEISSDKSTYKGTFHFHQCDLQDMSSLKNAFQWISSEFGGISILVNNAGVFKFVSLLELTEENYDKIFDTNVKGAFMCAKEAMNSMVKHNIPGHIININSILGLSVLNFLENKHTLYAASKHALKAFSEGLKYELTKKKMPIKVTNISPGPVKTEITDAEAPPDWKPEVDEFLEAVDVAKACIAVLDTSPYCLISELTIVPTHSSL